jgi:5'-nucleotidase/2',3'-cyclic-nucleotide 2'-phosphodiesterase/3'-nucleotidase
MKPALTGPGAVRPPHGAPSSTLAALALVLVSVLGCAGGVRGPRDLVIVHTNDIHGKFGPSPATWVEGNPPVGGFANLSAVLDSVRGQNPDRVLLLDAGDLMTGNPICDYEHRGAKGGAMMEFMNRMGYDVMCLGNHEFDHGLDELDRLLGLARFPIVSANTYRPQGGLTAPHRYVIIKRNGLRIGVVGLLTEDLYGVAAPAKLAGTRVTSMAEEAQKVIDEIDSKTDLIVLLTHTGVDDDRRLARSVRGVDLIVGGHSHTRLEEPVVENGVHIVQAGSHGRSAGRIGMTVENDRIAAFHSELVDLWPAAGARPEIAALAGEWEARIQADYGQVIGRLASAWSRSNDTESNIGNWLADRLREFGGGDFAVLNSGGIRKNMPAGPITRLDVLEILPFSNMVTTFTCTGRELLTLMERNARAASTDRYGILQVSGIRYAYEVAGEGVTILDPTVGGKPVDPERTYTGVSVDYVTHGNAERYLGFEPARREILGEVISSVIMQAIEASPSIDARVDGRIAGETRAARRAG